MFASLCICMRVFACVRVCVRMGVCLCVCVYVYVHSSDVRHHALPVYLPAGVLYLHRYTCVSATARTVSERAPATTATCTSQWHSSSCSTWSTWWSAGIATPALNCSTRWTSTLSMTRYACVCVGWCVSVAIVNRPVLPLYVEDGHCTKFCIL